MHALRLFACTAPTLVAAQDSVATTVLWIVLPAIVGLFLYGALAYSVWPYARPLVPLWIVLLAVVFPPFFPFFLLYILFAVCVFVPPTTPTDPVIVVVEDRSRRVTHSNFRIARPSI